MRTYARIQSGIVAELFATSENMSKLFHEHLLWLDVTASPEVQVGWIHKGDQFEPPALVSAPGPDSLAQLHAQLASLAQQVAALAEAKP